MSSDHTILSLDLGSTMGWALVKNAVIVQSGAVALNQKDAHPGHKFRQFENFLNSYTAVDEICFEDIPFQTSRDAARSYTGLLAILQRFCLDNRIRMVGINNTTVKTQFTGNYRAKKPEMCAVAHKMGWQHGEVGTDLDHDECDAIACVTVRLKMQNATIRFK